MLASQNTKRPARIFIVDDSAVMRSLLRSVIGTDPRIEVAGTASDGASALRAMPSIDPDIVLLDVEMPVMDGLSTLKQIRARHRGLPVIMCSALTQRGARVTIEALASGAADYVAKPSGAPSREAAVSALAQDLIPKILALTSTAGHNFESPSIQHGIYPLQRNVGLTTTSSLQSNLSNRSNSESSTPAVLLIGVSTGGPAALEALLPALPASFPLPVLIVQHMPELFTKMLAERLNGCCALPVSEAENGRPVRPGHIYIAKGNWHMEISCVANERASEPFLRLTQSPLENHCRPAVDVLFRSAVSVYGSQILAAVLTGMGHDGLAGCRIIRAHNGTVIAQDAATSAVWGMPGAVVQAGLAHRILPLPLIAAEIKKLSSPSQREAPGDRELTLRETAI